MGVSHCTVVEKHAKSGVMGKNDPLLCCWFFFLIYNCRVIFASAHDMQVHRCVLVLTILDCKRSEIRQNLAEQGRGQQEDSRLYLGGGITNEVPTTGCQACQSDVRCYVSCTTAGQPTPGACSPRGQLLVISSTGPRLGTREMRAATFQKAHNPSPFPSLGAKCFPQIPSITGAKSKQVPQAWGSQGS